MVVQSVVNGGSGIVVDPLGRLLGLYKDTWRFMTLGYACWFVVDSY